MTGLISASDHVETSILQNKMQFIRAVLLAGNLTFWRRTFFQILALKCE